MQYLLGKARKGSLNTKEKTEIDNYECAGHMVSLMKSKARRSLKGRRGNVMSRVH